MKTCIPSLESNPEDDECVSSVIGNEETLIQDRGSHFKTQFTITTNTTNTVHSSTIFYQTVVDSKNGTNMTIKCN